MIILPVRNKCSYSTRQIFFHASAFSFMISTLFYTFSPFPCYVFFIEKSCRLTHPARIFQWVSVSFYTIWCSIFNLLELCCFVEDNFYMLRKQLEIFFASNLFMVLNLDWLSRFKYGFSFFSDCRAGVKNGQPDRDSVRIRPFEPVSDMGRDVETVPPAQGIFPAVFKSDDTGSLQHGHPFMLGLVLPPLIMRIAFCQAD